MNSNPLDISIKINNKRNSIKDLPQYFRTNSQQRLYSKESFSNLNINYESEVLQKTLSSKKNIITNSDNNNANNNYDSKKIAYKLDKYNLNNYNLDELLDKIKLSDAKSDNNNTIIEPTYKRYKPNHRQKKTLDPINNKINKNNNLIITNDPIIYKVKSFKLYNSDMGKISKLLDKEHLESDSKCSIY